MEWIFNKNFSIINDRYNCCTILMKKRENDDLENQD